MMRYSVGSQHTPRPGHGRRKPTAQSAAVCCKGARKACLIAQDRSELAKGVKIVVKRTDGRWLAAQAAIRHSTNYRTWLASLEILTAKGKRSEAVIGVPMIWNRRQNDFWARRGSRHWLGTGDRALGRELRSAWCFAGRVAVELGLGVMRVKLAPQDPNPAGHGASMRPLPHA